MSPERLVLVRFEVEEIVDTGLETGVTSPNADFVAVRVDVVGRCARGWRARSGMRVRGNRLQFG